MARPGSLAFIAAIVAALCLPSPVSATHANSSCANASIVVVGSNIYPRCSMSLSCPAGASHPCRFTLSVSAEGVGYVAGRIFVPSMASPWAFCTGAMSCTANKAGFVVAAGTTVAVNCLGGDVAVNGSVGCIASAT